MENFGECRKVYNWKLDLVQKRYVEEMGIDPKKWKLGAASLVLLKSF